MNKVVVVAVAIVVLVAIAISITILVKPSTPSAALMLYKWGNASYIANYSIAYSGNLNAFGFLNLSASLIGPRLTWSQNTLNNITLSFNDSFYIKANNVGNGEYRLCVTIIGLTYCQNVSRNQLPLISTLSSSHWTYVGKYVISGITSYCYRSSSVSSNQLINATLCISSNGILTSMHVIKQTTSGHYDISLTLINAKVS